MKTQILLLTLLFSAKLLAEDLTTVSGKKYTGVTVTRVEPNGISITHDDGLAKVSFADLSEELRKKYGYDPKKAADFTQTEREAAARRAAATANDAAVTKAAKAAQNTPVKRLVGIVKQHLSGGVLIVNGHIFANNFDVTATNPNQSNQNYALLGYPDGDAIADDKLIAEFIAESPVIYVREAGVYKDRGTVYDALQYVPKQPPK